MTKNIVLTVNTHSQHVINDLIAGDFAVGHDPATDKYIVIGHGSNPETLTNGRFIIHDIDNKDSSVLDTETDREIKRFCTTPENNKEILVNVSDMEEAVVNYLTDSYGINYDKETDTYIIE